MKALHIIRGWSGSGKSTLAKYLEVASNGKHIETDMFFTDNEGAYNFDITKLEEAHNWCKGLVEWMMEEQKEKTIIVSNTFTRKWEYEPYLQLAEKYGYKVKMHVCKGDFKNVHGVPEYIVQKQKERFEY